jgi:imidazole glycerol-phosphate synthase
MGALKKRGLDGALADYVRAGRPFLGICLGLQLLFEGSEENGGVQGLGLIPGTVRRFTCDRDPVTPLPVPHIGWNDLSLPPTAGPPAPFLSRVDGRRVYFVHSFRAEPSPSNADWVAATSDYGGPFVAAVRKGDVCATQFHPEKSGRAGLDVLKGFLEGGEIGDAPSSSGRAAPTPSRAAGGLARRVIACLDVRANDAGDLVVTKGDQYDVREDSSGDESDGNSRDVRNLGKPVDLARRYYEEGADEVTFLNITGFRETPLGDLPMLEVLRRASEGVFVPLTVGGGIRPTTDPDGTTHSALAVAAEYFRSGADKVSIGSDAVEAALAYYARGGVADGSSAIEQISWVR